jgi:hypothetical protein
LKQHCNILRPDHARLQIVARVLLGLMMHTLFIVTTHHHPIHTLDAKSATPTVSQDSHTPEQHLPQSGDDFHCATCSLHRGLSSQHSAPVFIVLLSLQAVRRETFHCEPHSSGAFLALADRAPPIA